MKVEVDVLGSPSLIVVRSLWTQSNSEEEGTCIVSGFGLAVRRQAGKQKDLGLIPPRLSFLFKSCGLWTLSRDFVPHN